MFTAFTSSFQPTNAGDGQVSFEEFVKLIRGFAGMPPPPARGTAAPASSVPQFPPSAPPLPGGYGGMGVGMGMQMTLGQNPGYPPMGGGGMGVGMGVGVGGMGAGVAAAYGMGGSAAMAGSGDPIQDMETFQRMHGLDAEALKGIFRKFQEVDKDQTGMVRSRASAPPRLCARAPRRSGAVSLLGLLRPRAPAGPILVSSEPHRERANPLF